MKVKRSRVSPLQHSFAFIVTVSRI